MSRENFEIIGRFYDAMAEPGRPRVLEFFDPEVILTNTSISPETAPYVGHEGLVGWVRSVHDAMGEFRVTADETIDVDENRVIVVGRVCGEGRSTGLPLEVSTSTIYTLSNGRIVRADAYPTGAEALEAAGFAGAT